MAFHTNGRGKSANVEDLRFVKFLSGGDLSLQKHEPDFNDMLRMALQEARLKRGANAAPFSASDAEDALTLRENDSAPNQGGYGDWNPDGWSIPKRVGNIMWDGIVGQAAQALSHPGLTSAINTLHPGVMPRPAQMPATGITGYAKGGQVSGAAPDDPRMGMIADAEDALGHAEDGNELQPEHLATLQRFHDMFGPQALAHLHANVRQGMSMRPRKGRLVVGPKGDDKVPAMVDKTRKAKLTTGEFVMPVDAVHGAGQGDPVLGAQRLQQLSQHLTSLHTGGAAPGGSPPLHVEQVKR